MADPGPRLLAPPPPRALPTDLDRVGPPGWNCARHVASRDRLARRRQLEPTVGRGHGTDGTILLTRQRLTCLRVVADRGQDRAHGIQEVPERKAANLASLVGKAPTLLIEPGPTEHFHPARAALVWCRRRDDTFWIEILSLYLTTVYDDVLHGRHELQTAFSPRMHEFARGNRAGGLVGRVLGGELPAAREPSGQIVDRGRPQEGLDQTAGIRAAALRSGRRQWREALRQAPAARRSPGSSDLGDLHRPGRSCDPRSREAEASGIASNSVI